MVPCGRNVKCDPFDAHTVSAHCVFLSATDGLIGERNGPAAETELPTFFRWRDTAQIYSEAREQLLLAEAERGMKAKVRMNQVNRGTRRGSTGKYSFWHRTFLRWIIQQCVVLLVDETWPS